MSDRPERANNIDQRGVKTPETLPARYGRRAVMLGAATAGAGVAANLVGGGVGEAATDVSLPVLLGKSNTTSGTTTVTSRLHTGLSGHAQVNNQAGVAGFNTGAGINSFGVLGHSVHGTGVNGVSQHSNGIVGNAATVGFSGVAGIDFCKTKGAQGVYGQSNLGDAVLGVSFGGTGVVGHSRTPGQSGVFGQDAAPHGGNGVSAQSHNGTALFATSVKGVALHVDGRARFKNSGVAAVSAGQRTKTVSVPGMTASSLVLATIQDPQNGVFIEGAKPAAGSFTITLSKNAASSLPVAWFVLG